METLIGKIIITVALEIVWHLNSLSYPFTTNLDKNINLPKPISAKLFLNACQQMLFKFKYDFTNLVMNIVNKFDATITKELYGDDAEIEIKINSAYYDSFVKDIFERSNGQIIVKE